MNFDKTQSTVKLISIGGLLVSLTVMFQAMPVFLPLLGMAFSPFSTLPIAIAGIINVSLGVSVYIASALVLTLVSVEESLILLFTTGILGLIIGILLYRKGLIISMFSSGVTLAFGITVLTFVIGVFQLESLTNKVHGPFIIVIYLLFSLIYAFIWNMAVRKFINHLFNMKILEK